MQLYEISRWGYNGYHCQQRSCLVKEISMVININMIMNNIHVAVGTLVNIPKVTKVVWVTNPF